MDDKLKIRIRELADRTELPVTPVECEIVAEFLKMKKNEIEIKTGETEHQRFCKKNSIFDEI